MARLIDADTLPSALFQKHVHVEEALEPMLYFEDAVKVVENAPIIDAIPVEWLRKWPKDLREGAYVRDILMDWQKEQEAQDG